MRPRLISAVCFVCLANTVLPASGTAQKADSDTDYADYQLYGAAYQYDDTTGWAEVYDDVHLREVKRLGEDSVYCSTGSNDNPTKGGMSSIPRGLSRCCFAEHRTDPAVASQKPVHAISRSKGLIGS